MKEYGRLLHLWTWLRPFSGWVLAMLFSALVFFILAQANPLFVSWLIDWAIPSQQFQNVLLIIVSFFGVILLRQLFAIFMSYAYARVGTRIAVTIQHDLLQHLLQVDMRFFHQQRLGDLLARVNDDVQLIRDFMAERVVDILANILTLLISITIVAFFNWKLALAIVLFLPIIPLPFNKMRPRLREAFMTQRSANGANLAFLQEMISAVLPIRVADARKHVLRKQKGVADTLVQATVRQRVLQGIAAYAAELMGNLLTPLLVLGLGSYLVLSGELTIGQLIAAEMYAAGLVGPVVALSKINITIQGVLAALDRIDDILSVPTIPLGQNKIPTDLNALDLEVKDVSFAYHDTEPTLQDVSLYIKRGEKVAIVGPSGAGKSTLAYLLGGIIEPSQGTICLGNTPLASLANRSDLIMVVPQEPFLFHDTVSANIAFGLSEATSEAVQIAAAAAHIDRFIDKLPEQFATEVGERGVTLSGGEKQRLVLARALLRKPTILILDEVTSALDAQTEQGVWRTLNELNNTTRIIITHRIASAMAVDTVYVLSEGRIVESGRPQELLQHRGLFYQLWMTQSQQANGNSNNARNAVKPV